MSFLHNNSSWCEQRMSWKWWQFSHSLRKFEPYICCKLFLCSSDAPRPKKNCDQNCSEIESGALESSFTFVFVRLLLHTSHMHGSHWNTKEYSQHNTPWQSKCNLARVVCLTHQIPSIELIYIPIQAEIIVLLIPATLFFRNSIKTGIWHSKGSTPTGLKRDHTINFISLIELINFLGPGNSFDLSRTSLLLKRTWSEKIKINLLGLHKGLFILMQASKKASEWKWF